MEAQTKDLNPSLKDITPYTMKVVTYNVLADAYTKGSSLKNYPGKDLAVL